MIQKSVPFSQKKGYLPPVGGPWGKWVRRQWEEAVGCLALSYPLNKDHRDISEDKGRSEVVFSHSPF